MQHRPNVQHCQFQGCWVLGCSDLLRHLSVGICLLLRHAGALLCTDYTLCTEKPCIALSNTGVHSGYNLSLAMTHECLRRLLAVSWGFHWVPAHCTYIGLQPPA